MHCLYLHLLNEDMKTTDDLLKYILLESDGLMILICLSSSKAMLYNSMS